MPRACCESWYSWTEEEIKRPQYLETELPQYSGDRSWLPPYTELQIGPGYEMWVRHRFLSVSGTIPTLHYVQSGIPVYIDDRGIWFAFCSAKYPGLLETFNFELRYKRESRICKEYLANFARFLDPAWGYITVQSVWDETAKLAILGESGELQTWRSEKLKLSLLQQIREKTLAWAVCLSGMGRSPSGPFPRRFK